VYFIDAKGYNKIKGTPITKTELVEEIRKYIKIKKPSTVNS